MGSSLAGLGTPRVGVWLAVAGWAALAALWVTGTAGTVGHDQEGVPAVLATGLFLGGWVSMIAAMMLPSSLPAFGRIDRALGARGAWATIMVGYFGVWLAFGGAAFIADGILHLSIEHLPWLAQRPALLPAAVAIFAGAAELRGRAPAPRAPSIDPSAGPYAMGKAHALDRIRRCWPLMLFAMAVGMNAIAWMVSLTLLMVLELRPRAATILRLGGLALIALGVAVVVEPTWLPMLIGAG